MKTKLYIIGNGFDIHHDIPSKYSNYHDWLEEHDNDLLSRLRDYYNVDDLDWWNQFEIQLGYPDMTDYIDETAFENQPDYGNDEFRDRDYYTGQITAEDEIGALVADIKETFTDWVASLPAPNSDKIIALDKENAFFINFNYTDTLQILYNVKPEDILFIHGNVGYKTELVLGHNRSYKELNDEYTPEMPEPPEDLNEEDMLKWYDENNDSGEDFIHQSVREAVVSQISNLSKDTKIIIYGNKKSFESLNGVKIIYVYGLSFSPVDEPYLEEIANKVNSATTNWVISYYSEEDKEKAKRFFIKEGIAEGLVSYVRLEDLMLVKQMEIEF